jgi:dTDP-4-dehydrorhamnose 3,5-epimerase
MNRTPTSLPDVLLLEPRVFEDARGHFYESYRQDTLRSLGIGAPFVQENHSLSRSRVLRGLHYQIGHPQAKLIRVVQGEIFDVAVDIRRGSPTFGSWVGQRLSAKNRLQLYVPEGFAHGFLVLSETAEVIYRVTDFYAPAEERGIAWNDPGVGVVWPEVGGAPVLNARDAALPRLAASPERDLPVYRL